MRSMFTWPWCWGHNSPMVRGENQWMCHFAGTPTRDGSEGCQATTIEFQWTGHPFDLTKPLKANR